MHSVMEICSGKRSNMSSALWFQIRAPESEKVWETHDWVYLQSKGAFDLPSIDVCDCLIRAYFEHVHPLLPIIDASHFLSQYTLKGASSMNLLLLWSVFLAAANVKFTDSRLLSARRHLTIFPVCVSRDSTISGLSLPESVEARHVYQGQGVSKKPKIFDSCSLRPIGFV